MIKTILVGVAAVIALILVIAAFQPEDFRVERRATFAAPASAVFPHVNEFRNWERWSPWEKLDPEMKRTFSGPQGGTGASYAWAGNSKVGEGKMTVLESRPAELVRIKLEFIKPFAATNDTEFAFKTEGKQTTVVWTMAGKKNYLSKVMCLFADMDKMVGGDFEKGLAALKAVVETAPQT
jgi:hypothetical protein